MSDLFDELGKHLLGKEGGYVNHPDDRGGETNWGITVGVARANGYGGSMRDMTRDQALSIYRREYWEKPGFALVATVSPRIAQELFDTGVNMGQGVPAKWFQRILNVLNRQGADYADIAADGQIGPATMRAFTALIAKRGKDDAINVVLRGLNGLQAARYIELAENRAANESFAFGWLAQRVGME